MLKKFRDLLGLFLITIFLVSLNTTVTFASNLELIGNLGDSNNYSSNEFELTTIILLEKETQNVYLQERVKVFDTNKYELIGYTNKDRTKTYMEEGYTDVNINDVLSTNTNVVENTGMEMVNEFISDLFFYMGGIVVALLVFMFNVSISIQLVGKSGAWYLVTGVMFILEAFILYVYAYKVLTL